MGMYTGGCSHAHRCWCPSLSHTACCNTTSASRTNGKHTVTARLVHVFLAYRPSVVCLVLLLFLRGSWCCGVTHTDMTVCSGAFYTVKLNSSSHCYTERKDVVHCWNAASSQVKISILETANIGSCILLNPVALCKAGSMLSGSADTTEQGRPGPICNRTWVQCASPPCFWRGSSTRSVIGVNVVIETSALILFVQKGCRPGLCRGISLFAKSGRPQAKQMVEMAEVKSSVLWGIGLTSLVWPLEQWRAIRAMQQAVCC